MHNTGADMKKAASKSKDQPAGYKKGGKVKCMAGGGKVRGGGAAKRGLKFSRSC
jgi:hypothetical protein